MKQEEKKENKFEALGWKFELQIFLYISYFSS